MDRKLTFGQRTADKITAAVGSWAFLITQNGLIVVWCFLNLVAWINHWDPYPFLLLNICMSWQAANASPVIMMSQNRQAERDHQQIDRIEQMVAKNEEMANRILSLENLLSQHVDSMQALLTKSAE